MTSSSRSSHRCDDRCVCPAHKTPLWYAPFSDEHACADPECEFAHGLEVVQAEQFITEYVGSVRRRSGCRDEHFGRWYQ